MQQENHYQVLHYSGSLGMRFTQRLKFGKANRMAHELLDDSFNKMLCYGSQQNII